MHSWATRPPSPVSALNWTVFVSTPQEHHFAHVNVMRTAPRSYRPGDGFVARSGHNEDPAGADPQQRVLLRVELGAGLRLFLEPAFHHQGDRFFAASRLRCSRKARR